MGAGGGRAGTADAARRQHGLVGRSQLLELGRSESALKRDVRAGRLERVHPQALRVAGAPSTWEQHVHAAVLGCGTGGFASHRSAARLWGLADDDETIEVSVSRTRLPRLGGVTVHRSGDLDPRWCTTRHRIPVTNPLRTLVDLGAVTSHRVVGEAVERALVSGLVSVAALEWARAAHAGAGRRGVGVLGRILDRRALGSRPADSVLEARMASLLQRHGLPPPAFQHEVSAGRRLVARVDFAYPELLLALEVDGLASHGTADALQHDLQRQNALVGCGWTVLRFTWNDVVLRSAKVATAVEGVRRRLAAPLGA
jgi:very-short-patch-repair endonuclease